ncbi:hypothetical protein Tco_0824471 [Tanacetum coccineum]|uniref:Uncharacterized protein n=1 Tax=Tanacetum coccineum TaxID=301880 RepID=A0ABQ5ANI1_9ASTR
MSILHSFEKNKLEYEDEDEVEIKMMGTGMDKESLELNLYENDITPIICHNFSLTSNPLIKSKDSGSFRMKVVEPLTIHTPTSPHMAFLHQNVIMEYLVKISKKARILELKRRYLKITVLTSYTPHLYDYDCDKEKGSDRLKDLEAYSIRTTLRNDALPQKEKDIGSFTLHCYINNVCFEKSLADLGANICVMPFLTYTNLGLGELAHTKLNMELADRTVKHPKGIAENVLVGIGKFVFPVDFIILDMLEDVKVPLILGRPFLSTAPAKIDVFKRKIALRFYNSIMKDKVEYNGRNVLGTFVNAPIFVGNFFVVTDFTVVENMDAYRDEGIGEVIVGESFCKASYMEARRFDGMISIFNGKNSVTYQMVRSHPRFKHLIDKQCNKIPPLLKVSKQDKMNEISHSYQKLKGFYKGILDLGPKFIQDEKIVERLTCGCISVHEME